MSGALLRISPGALLLFALAFFFDDTGIISALLPAAAIHESGHVAAILACGGRIRSLELNIFGLKLDYSASFSRRSLLLCVAAGPLAGALYAAAAFLIGGTFLLTSGAVSILLTLFNLAPALPLDGGRIMLLAVGPHRARRISLAAAAALTLCGLALLFRHGSVSLLLAGAWLIIYNIP